MAPKTTRYTTLKEINVALGYIVESNDRMEKVILGNGIHQGLVTAMVLMEDNLSAHLKEYKEARARKAYIKDKLFIGTVLSLVGSAIVLLKSCAPL